MSREVMEYNELRMPKQCDFKPLFSCLWRITGPISRRKSSTSAALFKGRTNTAYREKNSCPKNPKNSTFAFALSNSSDFPTTTGLYRPAWYFNACLHPRPLNHTVSGIEDANHLSIRFNIT